MAAHAGIGTNIRPYASRISVFPTLLEHAPLVIRRGDRAVLDNAVALVAEARGRLQLLVGPPSFSLPE
jgi:hypothetical protein